MVGSRRVEFSRCFHQAWAGVKAHLCNTPPLKHLPAVGAEDWVKYGFDTLQPGEMELDGQNGEMVLTVYSEKPRMTVHGFEKYGKTWARMLQQAFGRSVQIQVRHEVTA